MWTTLQTRWCHATHRRHWEIEDTVTWYCPRCWQYRAEPPKRAPLPVAYTASLVLTGSVSLCLGAWLMAVLLTDDTVRPCPTHADRMIPRSAEGGYRSLPP